MSRLSKSSLLGGGGLIGGIVPGATTEEDWARLLPRREEAVADNCEDFQPSEREGAPSKIVAGAALAAIVFGGAALAQTPKFGSCPYTDMAATDGCENAPTTNRFTVQRTGFFTGYASQNGQRYTSAAFSGVISGGVLKLAAASGSAIRPNDTIIGSGARPGVRVSGAGVSRGDNILYPLANADGVAVSGPMQALHRPPWNVAGVDYPVGICKTGDACANGHNTASLLAPTNGNLPRGCAFAGTAPDRYVECSGGSGDLDIEGYDFGAGAGCVSLYIENWKGGTIAIRNDRFYNSSPTDASSPCTKGSLIFVLSPTVTSAIDIENDYFDGNAEAMTSTVPAYVVAILGAPNAVAGVTVKDSVFLNVPNQAISVSSNGIQHYDNNYFENLAPRPESGHAEFTLSGTNTGPLPLEDFSYNTALVDKNTQGATAEFYVSTGFTDGLTINAQKIYRNTMVSNYNARAGGYVTDGLVFPAGDRVGSLTIAENYFDPTGASACARVAGNYPIGAIAWAGNIDMLDGSAADTDQSPLTGGSANGTRLTIKWWPPWSVPINQNGTVFVTGVNPSGWNGAYGSDSREAIVAASPSPASHLVVTNNSTARYSSGGMAVNGNPECRGRYH